MNNWISGSGPQSNMILSSRVRLARNICNMPFPGMMNDIHAKRLLEMMRKSSTALGGDKRKYRFLPVEAMDTLQKQVLVERHLISPNLAKENAGAAALISDDEVVSIMINEEDHIRIQAILPGMQIRGAWEVAGRVDDQLEQSLDYAFDENWGYMTSCPTNVGTGLRASVMLHLPALHMTGNINKILQAVTQIGLTIRGLYGEGTDFSGSLFQLSNQITLGRSEEELVDNLAVVTMQIVEKEKEARNAMMNASRLQLEDKVWRAYGLITNARMLQSQECLKLISDVRMGVDLNILKSIPGTVLNEIMIETQPASLQSRYGHELSSEERDKIRAEIVRNKLE